MSQTIDAQSRVELTLEGSEELRDKNDNTITLAAGQRFVAECEFTEEPNGMPQHPDPFIITAALPNQIPRVCEVGGIDRCEVGQPRYPQDEPNCNADGFPDVGKMFTVDFIAPAAGAVLVGATGNPQTGKLRINKATVTTVLIGQ